MEASQLEELYAAHFQSLTAQVHAYIADFDGAQEIVQEAFCRAIPRWSKISQYEDPLGWIRKVAFNLAVSRWRRARTAVSYLNRQRVETVDGPSPDRIALIEALKTLPEKYRRAVVLHHLSDLSVADIARSEGVPEGTIRTWLHRGRNALADRLIDDARLTYDSVRPPGLDAARETVARRRTARTVALAIIAAVLLVVTAATSFVSSKKDLPILPPSPSPSLSPSPDNSFSPSTPPTPGATASQAPARANGPLSYRAIFASSQSAAVLLPRTQPFSVPFGPSLWSDTGGGGTVHNLVITANLSSVLSKVEVISLPSQCGLGGSTLTCRYPSLGQGDHLGTIMLRARSGAAAGTAGSFALTSTADEGSRYRDPTDAFVSIHPDDNLADLTVTNRANNLTRGGGASDQITIAAGNQLSVTTTLVNRGPAAVTVTQLSTAGLKLVSGAGCKQESTFLYSESLSCTHVVASGATVSYTTLIEATACNGGGFLFGQPTPSVPAPISLNWRNQWMIHMNNGC